MTPNDILLHIGSYPEPTPPAAIEEAVGFAKLVGGTLSALAIHVRFPVRTNFLAEQLIGLAGLAAEEESRSLETCEAGMADFTRRAEAAGVLGQTLIDRVDYYLLGEQVANRARTRDLCIVPLAGRDDGQAAVVQAAVFGSGRPVLAFRSGVSSLPSSSLGSVVLAWDGSRNAARAMADALPLLRVAAEVRVLTILDEKPGAVPGLGVDAVRHLLAHGVKAVVEEVEAAEKRIGQAFDACLERRPADLWVMGAYGHNRLREFVLGGATEHMLRDPKVPVLLSH